MRESELNLIPADIIEHEVLKERVRSWIFRVALCLLLLIFINILIMIANHYIIRDITILASESERLSREIAELKQLDMQVKDLLTIKEKIRHLSQKGPMMEIFAAIDRAINDHITLTYLETRYSHNDNPPGDKGEAINKGYFNSAPPVKTSKPQAVEENRVIIKGAAQSNADLAYMLSMLTRQHLFKAINFKYSRRGEGEKGKPDIFEIECKF